MQAPAARWAEGSGVAIAHLRGVPALGYEAPLGSASRRSTSLNEAIATSI
jgi:hypothetical protein